MASRKHVTIYTDGACIGNPGPGGYAVVLIHGENRCEFSGGFRHTTNNRMELMGPIKALDPLNQCCRVTLYSDSKYVVDGINKGWARRWRDNDWMRNKRQQAVNADLWGTLLDLYDKHEVEFRWVRGHANNPDNERCDQLANQAASRKDLPMDKGYESPGL